MTSFHLLSGMNSGLILNDEQLLKKQELIKANKEKNKAKKEQQEQQRLKKLKEMYDGSL